MLLVKRRINPECYWLVDDLVLNVIGWSLVARRFITLPRLPRDFFACFNLGLG